MERVEAAREFAHFLTDGERLPYTLAIHRGQSKEVDKADNPHCHLVISERSNDGVERTAAGWFKRHKPKRRGGGSAEGPDELEGVAAEHAGSVGRACEPGAGTGWKRRTGGSPDAGGATEAALERGDMEAAAELDREPGVHLGPARFMEMKGRGDGAGEAGASGPAPEPAAAGVAARGEGVGAEDRPNAGEREGAGPVGVVLAGAPAGRGEGLAGRSPAEGSRPDHRSDQAGLGVLAAVLGAWREVSACEPGHGAALQWIQQPAPAAVARTGTTETPVGGRGKRWGRGADGSARGSRGRKFSLRVARGR